MPRSTKKPERPDTHASVSQLDGELFFRAFTEQNLEGVALVDPQGNISVWNEAMARITGIKARAVLGMKIWSVQAMSEPDLVDVPKRVRALEESYKRAFKTGKIPPAAVHGESILRHAKDGRLVHVEQKLFIIKTVEGNWLGAMFRDISERKQAEEQNKKLKSELETQLAENLRLLNELQADLVERKKLIAEYELKQKISETLSQSASLVVSKLEITDTVQQILLQLKRVVHYDSASVWLYRGDTAYMVGSSDLPEGAETPGFYKIENSEPDYIFREQPEAPYIIYDDIQKLFPQFKDSLSYIRGWMAVPLRARGRLTGFIALDSRTPGRYTSAEAHLALSFANQVAVAVENARLFSELQKELEERQTLIYELELRNKESETLRESTAIVSATLEMNEAVGRILDQLARVVPYHSASVQLISDGMLEIVSARGWNAEADVGMRFEMGPDEPSAPLVTEDRPYVLFDDIQEVAPAFRVPPHNVIHAWMAIPLKSKGRVMGIIALDGHSKGQFNERHARLAASYANQVAITLENARLFSDLQQELAQRKKLIASLEAVTFSARQFLQSTNWREVISTVLERLGRELNASHAYLFEKHLSESGEVLNSLRYEWTAPGQSPDIDKPDYQNTASHYEGFERYYQILDSGEPFVGSASLLSAEERALFAKAGIRALLEIRIIVNGEHWGTMGFDDMVNDREWSEAEVDIVRVAAGVLSAAIKRQIDEASLKDQLKQRKQLIQELEARNRESETLREIAAIVAATLEEGEAVTQILDQMLRVVPYDSASVQLFVDGMLEVVSVRGEGNLDQIGARYHINADEPSLPIINGEPYVLHQDVQVSTKVFIDPPHNLIRAWLAVPLKTKGTLIGIIALDGHQPGQFTERHARLAVSYANQVAVALENARLFSELQEQLDKKEILVNELEAKNAELERFTYTVSHDLKSPLVTISGFLGYLEKDALQGDLERIRIDVQRIQDAVDKMRILLQDLLDLSRIGRLSNPPEWIGFEEIVHEVESILHGQLEKNNITLHTQPDLPAIYGDRQRLIEVLQNLIDNAIKFMGTQPEPHIEIGAYTQENGQPVFFVRDNGIGIPREFRERIFGLFDKLDPKSEGSGVGLAIVRRIIEVHGGRIWVESDAGRGSAFYFTVKRPLPDL